MSAVVLDGKKVRDQIFEELALKNQDFQKRYGRPVGLATVLVGENPASQSYIRSKHLACEKLGFYSHRLDLSAKTTMEELKAEIEGLIKDSKIDGILVQLPLPDHLDEREVLSWIPATMDVDGFAPENFGKLALKGHTPEFIACTPKGCMRLMKEYGIEVEGKKAVVIGRSNIVGLPMFALLNNANATTTVVHSRTQNLKEVVQEADIVVAAIGRATMLDKSWIKEGAVVIDVGINKVDDPEAKRGYRIVGDVDGASVAQVAGFYSPVPGGVGPMTIAMLMENALEAAYQREEEKVLA